MSFYPPPKSSAFNGYYSKFRLPSGSSLALIISSVSRENIPRPFLVSVSYVTRDGSQWWQRDYFPDTFGIQKDVSGGFTISWATGEFGWQPLEGKSSYGRDHVWWRIHEPQFDFVGESKCQRTPWKPGNPNSTPAGLLAHLPLPIQWHVQSLDSPCDFTLEIDSPLLAPEDRRGTARVHMEKNWAHSFPLSYIWLQARDHHRQRGICVAGGSLLPGVNAYLIGYQHEDLWVSFAPPTSTSILGFSFGLESLVSFSDSVLELTVTGWFTRLRIRATAPKDTYFILPAPLATGHQPGYTAQSFAATIQVHVDRRAWPLGSWREIQSEQFTDASLEFGGDFYKSQGKRKID